MKITLIFLTILTIGSAYGQNTFHAILKDSTSGEILVGATAVVKGTSNGTFISFELKSKTKNLEISVRI